MKIQQRGITMYKFQNEDAYYYYYENSNRYSKSKFTRKQADIAIKTLKNCEYCEDCEDCEDCINCYYCNNCNDCNDCNDCYNCNSCDNCYRYAYGDNLRFREGRVIIPKLPR